MPYLLPSAAGRSYFAVWGELMSEMPTSNLPISQYNVSSWTGEIEETQMPV